MTELLRLNDRYELLHPIGTGGMAVVHKAIDTMLERTVAIKLLRDDFSNDTDFRDRFRQEARSAANLSHPNIITVYDFGLDQQYLFIVMEFISGTDLKSIIRQKGRFTVRETLNLMVQACAGVGYAHRAGLVHCDIKPHNMLVSNDQRLKVTDFGIARALATITPEEQSDVVWGSPHYFSPEQASGSAPSPASDVYSLGIILYEMLTGHLPFISNDATELARMHREDQPTPPRLLNKEIPTQLEEIILKVLSKEPSSRYRTADQLGRILSGLLQSQENIIAEVPPQLTYANHHPAPVNDVTKFSEENIQQEFMTNVPDGKNSFFQQSPKSETDKIPVSQKKFDWITWGLGLAAFTMLLGLIPFWLYIYLSLKP